MASRPDALGRAQLEAEVVRPRFLAWLDIVGDPVRATTWPTALTPTGTGDPELDGQEFVALDPTLVDVSPVQYSEGGADTVTMTLSGLILADNDLLNVIGNRANWQGRVARLWQGVANAEWAPQGVIWAYYTGYITNMRLVAAPERQVIEVQVESYLAALAPPSLRTYLDQAEFDPLDQSAAATLAAANGGTATGVVTTAPGGGGGGGKVTLNSYIYEQISR